jgi:urease accessory protein
VHRWCLFVERAGVRRVTPGLSLIACAGIALAPAVAQAHLMVTGLGPIYDGISHFATSPEDFLPLIALAFLAGLRAPRHARALFYTLPLAWFAGAVYAMLDAPTPAIILSALTAGLFLTTGGCLACRAKLSLGGCVALGTFLGLVRGTANFSSLETSGANLLTLAGVCVAVTILFTLAVSVTLPLKRLWLVVAARAYGSWIAALGLFLAGWIVRYGAGVL